jgi:putative ABC transport system permease protein
MLALDQKALRDIWRMRWQFFAISLVVACGVGMLTMAWCMLASLERTQQRYYTEYRFGHVFARVKRAPISLQAQLHQIPGVVQAEVRIVEEVTLDLTGMLDPANARLVSISETPEQGLHRLHLRRGRMPSPGATNEAVVSEPFALANRLQPGDEFSAIFNGSRKRIKIVGIALSPEFVYQIRPGEMLPNNRTYGVIWMMRNELDTAFDLEGAFNDVVLFLAPEAKERQVIERLDELLGDYGSVGAYCRDLQASNRYVTNELRELRNMGFVAPAIFLAVAAFLMNIVLSRMINAQRTQIATLRAFGYTSLQIGIHYIKIASLVVIAGACLGLVLGGYLGHGMAQMYSNFFHFPHLEFQIDFRAVVAGGVVSLGATLLGVLTEVRHAAQLAPAIAMQPDPPSAFRLALPERLGLARWLSPTTRMTLRCLERKPLQTFFSVVGLSLAVAVIVLGNHSADSIDALIDFQFGNVQRHHYSVGFFDPTSGSALRELAHLPGVRTVEPFRGVVAELRHGNRNRRQELTGLVSHPALFRLVERDGGECSLPPSGLVLSRKLGEMLDVVEGQELEVHILEGQRPKLRIRVDSLIDDLVGVSAYVNIDFLRRILGEGDTISGAFLRTNGEKDAPLLRYLKESPHVSFVSSKQASLDSLRDTLATTMLRMRAINLLFAAVIACGVVYNTARIILAERAYDLASMRILGFTRAEISSIFLGEIAILSMMAIPLGIVLGYALVALATWGYDTELFRLPIVINPSTYVFAAVAVLTATLVSALVVRRRLDHLDIVGVLKARE